MPGRLHRHGNNPPHLLCRFDKVRVGKVGVGSRGPVSPMPKQLADQGRALTSHDGLAGSRVPEVMQA